MDTGIKSTMAVLQATALLGTSPVLMATVSAQGLPSSTAIAQTPTVELEELYHRAVRDAAVVESGENVKGLTAIRLDNRELIWNSDKSKLLVVTWKSQDSFDRFIRPHTQTNANPDYVIWVTAAPQVQAFCNEYLKQNPNATAEEVNLRLKQYLGLHQDWSYDVFIELWVSPEDIFRPCVDPEITDTQCNLTFKQDPPTVKNIPNYPSFYKSLYFKDFRMEPGVPWTGLGYTYDWQNPPTNEVGASEFILVPEATYAIHQAVPTMKYCRMSSTQ